MCVFVFGSTAWYAVLKRLLESTKMAFSWIRNLLSAARMELVTNQWGELFADSEPMEVGDDMLANDGRGDQPGAELNSTASASSSK